MKKNQKNLVRYYFVCTGKDCLKRGAKQLLGSLEQELPTTSQFNTVVIKTKCIDHCKQGPLLVVDNVCYEKVDPKYLKKILKKINQILI